MRNILILLLICFVAVEAGAKDKIKIASVQYPIVGNLTYPQFKEKVLSYIKKAKKQNVDLILFPEHVVLDMTPLESKKSEKDKLTDIANASSANYLGDLVKWAHQYNITIVGGSYARILLNGETANSSPVVAPSGLLGWQTKIFSTPWAKEVSMVPGTELQKFTLPGTENRHTQ